MTTELATITTAQQQVEIITKARDRNDDGLQNVTDGFTDQNMG